MSAADRHVFAHEKSQIQFHQSYNLLRDVCYKKMPCTRVAVLAVLLSISENISTSSAILNSRTLSPKLGHVNENLNSDWLVVCFGRGYQI